MDHNTTPDKSDDVKEAEAKFFAKYAKAPMPLIHLLPIVTTETIQKERSSVRYQRAEGQKYKPNLARKPRGQAVPLQDCNSTVVQRNLYEVRQMAGP